MLGWADIHGASSVPVSCHLWWTGPTRPDSTRLGGAATRAPQPALLSRHPIRPDPTRPDITLAGTLARSRLRPHPHAQGRGSGSSRGQQDWAGQGRAACTGQGSSARSLRHTASRPLGSLSTRPNMTPARHSVSRHPHIMLPSFCHILLYMAGM